MPAVPTWTPRESIGVTTPWASDYLPWLTTSFPWLSASDSWTDREGNLP